MTENTTEEKYEPSEQLVKILDTMDTPAEPNVYKSDAERILEEAREARKAARERLMAFIQSGKSENNEFQKIREVTVDWTQEQGE